MLTQKCEKNPPSLGARINSSLLRAGYLNTLKNPETPFQEHRGSLNAIGQTIICLREIVNTTMTGF